MRRILFATLLCIAPLVCRAESLPADDELKALALDSLLSFNKAVQARDFTAFHKQISALWQAQATPTTLKNSFQSFIDLNTDISSIASEEPVFDGQPTIDSDGVLVFKGTYAATPIVDFRLKYIYEKTAWKLIGIKVDARPAGDAGKLPSEEEAKALVQASLLAFSAAVQTKSFVDFHKEIAVMWQEQITPEGLAESFASFLEGDVDLSDVARSEPTFEKPPATNEDGLLELKGVYLMKERKVLFDLAYLYEAPEWKMSKIDVNIRPAQEKDPPRSDDDDEDE